MDDNENMLSNISGIASLFGGSENKINPTDLIKTMEMAKKFGKIQKLMTEEEEFQNLPIIETDFISAPAKNSSMELMKVALPFLDKKYQKPFLLALKTLEFKSINSYDTLPIKSQSSEQSYVPTKKDMLRAIKPFLSEAEQKSIDSIIQMSKMKNMINLISKEEI